LASVSEVLNRYRPAPLTGFSACALAFSTLLSSQGADAHHRSALAGFRGNPSNLPASSRPVKSRSAGSSIACQLAASLSLPAVRDHPFPGSVPQAVLTRFRLVRGAGPPAAFRVPRGRRNTRQQSGFRQIGASRAGHRQLTSALTCAARFPTVYRNRTEPPALPSAQQKSAKKYFLALSPPPLQSGRADQLRQHPARPAPWRG
jgi:hypothetical protein